MRAIDTGCCLLWTGPVDTRLRRHQHRPVDTGGRSVTRGLMEEHLGRELGRAEYVLHNCDEYLCVRLDHLYVGTARQNRRDAMERVRTKPLCTLLCKLTAEDLHSQLWTAAVDKAHRDVAVELAIAGGGEV